MTGVYVRLFWVSYAAWIALFAWIAWRRKLRMLLALGAAKILAFTACYVVAEHWMRMPGRNHSGDLGYVLFVWFAAAVLLAPLAVACLVYPIGRLWAR